MHDYGNGPVDEVSFGRERGRPPRPPWFPRGRWLDVAGLAVAVLVVGVIVLLTRSPGHPRHPPPDGVSFQSNENLIAVPLGGQAGGDLEVQYLGRHDGQPRVRISVAAAGLPRGVKYRVAAGDCHGLRPQTLSSATGRPDGQTGLLLLTLDKFPGSPQSILWVRVTTASGVELGAVRSPFTAPDSGVEVPPGSRVCPLAAPGNRHALAAVTVSLG